MIQNVYHQGLQGLQGLQKFSFLLQCNSQKNINSYILY